MNRVTVVLAAETPAGRAVIERLTGEGHLIAALVEDDLQAADIEADFDPDLVLAAVVDPTDPDSLSDALDNAADAFGPPSGLVVILPEPARTPLLAGGLEALTAVVEQRILGALALATLALERFEDGGAILFVAPPRPGAEPTALAGLVVGALDGFVRGAAAELRGRGLTVNLIPAEQADRLAAFLLSEEGRGVTGQRLSS